jgi:hypothetical protein
MNPAACRSSSNRHLRNARMKTKAILFAFFVLAGLLPARAQYLPPAESFWEPHAPPGSLAKLRQRNFGAILGVQRGRYMFFEFGAEHHWRTISLTNPRIYALSANAAYNFGHNVLGYNATFWFKQGRINLTYGLNAAYYTDFTHARYGGGPVVGFRLLGFHLATGYNYLAGNKTEGQGLTKVNPLYISLRYYFPVSNDFDWDKKKKDNDKGDRAKEKTKKKKAKDKAKRKKQRIKEKTKKRKAREKEKGKDEEKKSWWPFKK